MHRHRAGQPVRDGQRSLPILGRRGTVHVFQQRFCVAPGKGQRRNFRQRPCFLRLDAFRSRNRSPARGCGITRHDVVVCDCAALNVTLRSPRPFGKHFPARVAVFRRIGINQQCSRAFALRRQRFESAVAVGIRIANQHNFPFDVNAALAQQIIIFGIPAVRVDHFRRDIARRRVSKVSSVDGGILCIRIRFDGVFAQRRHVAHRRGHFQRNTARTRMQNVVAPQRHVFPTLLSPFVCGEIRKLSVALGRRRMRFRRKRPVPFPRLLGRRNRLKVRLEAVLRPRVRRRKAQNVRWARIGFRVLCKKDCGKNQDREQTANRANRDRIKRETLFGAPPRGRYPRACTPLRKS